VLESEKNHFGVFAKNIFNLNIQYKTTNNLRYECFNQIIDCLLLTKQFFQKENICLCFITYMGNLSLGNILSMFHHIHGTFKFGEFGAAVSNEKNGT
jgi:hypothetical protein